LADQFLKGTSKNDGAKRLPQIFNFQFSIINFTMTHYITDTFFNGRIQVKQNRVGYRFSIDAVLLAYQAAPRSGDKVIDLGAGCGIISLIMAYRRPDITVTAVEVQEELAQLAISNVKNNHLQDRITVLDADMRTMKPDMMAGPVDLVVCNPPYRRPGSGRINPDNQRAVARHELKANLQDVMFAARRFLKTGGRFITIYTAERTADILCQMRADSIEPKCFRTIHSDPSSEAKLILVEGIKGGNPGLKIAPPLIVYDKNGDYTDDVQQMFEP
jgi:tRNA1Val (adenine37-N6)-methyltransferase